MRRRKKRWVILGKLEEVHAMSCWGVMLKVEFFFFFFLKNVLTDNYVLYSFCQPVIAHCFQGSEGQSISPMELSVCILGCQPHAGPSEPTAGPARCLLHSLGSSNLLGYSGVMEQCGDEGLWSQRDLELEPGFHAY